MRPRRIGFSGPLAEDMDRFIAHKRALGRRFHTEEKALQLFDAYLVQIGVTGAAAISPDQVAAFLASRPRQRPRSYNHLVGVLRRFFNWLVVQGVLDGSPLQVEPRRETSRRIPFIFDTVQAKRLLSVVAALPDRNKAPMRGPTYHMMFALLYGLGLRVGEVTRLRCKDVDLDGSLLVVRGTKFGKDRLVPMGPKMAALLKGFLERRASSGPLSQDDPVFSFCRGRPVNPGSVSQLFHHLVPRLGLDVPPGVRPPRLHDLRHAFAVGTLLRWYRQGVDPAHRLLRLSTFLGHVNPTSTAVYLTITDELLHEANDRFERFAATAVGEVAP